ncbi:hypothetical protein ACQEVS_04055 [Streptomyces sp. CA-181903]|uniref:hypothetical protein n=1 Tax=Streptomyces sp. CA-181903 TaxID=3240055 RepID=UPI003D93101C
MEWTSLVGTALGAIIATASGALLERRRWRRERGERDAAVRRALYAEYLAGLAEARSAGAVLARNTAMDPADRFTTAREAFAPCIRLRYQMAITAPADVVRASDEAFRRLRDFRDRVIEGAGEADSAYVDGKSAYNEALSALQELMRQDLVDEDTGSRR